MYQDSDYQIQTSYNGSFILSCYPYQGKPRMCMSCDPESIAAFMLTANARVYIYDTFALNVNGMHYDAEYVANEVMGYIHSLYINKPGKRPAISVDIVSADTGMLVKRFSIVGVTGK